MDGKRKRVRKKKTHKIPNPKTAYTPPFSPLRILSLQTSRTGSANVAISPTILLIAFAYQNTSTSMHRPSTPRSHARATGVQRKTVATTLASM